MARPLPPVIFLTIGSKIPTGKYKGRTVKAVLTVDPEYILWLDRNMRGITLKRGIAEEARARVGGKKFKWERR